MRLWLLLAGTAILLACVCIMTGCLNSDVQDISPSEFVRLYNEPRTELHHLDYAGTCDGYYWLKEFGVGKNGSYVRLVKIYRTATNDLVAGAVQHCQPPLTSTTPPASSVRFQKPPK